MRIQQAIRGRACAGGRGSRQHAAVIIAGVIAAFALAACGEGAPKQTQTPAAEEPSFLVISASVRAMTPAFGQIGSVDAVPARARVSGTLIDVKVREGDRVVRGEVIATIADARVPLQARAEGAQAAAIAAQLSQARADLQRFERLHAQGYLPTQRLDQQRVTVTSLEDQLRAARTQRSVTVETGAQGAIQAPVSGTVLRAPARRGAVVMMGEDVALIGSSYVIKLQVPERNAKTLRADLAVDVEASHGQRQPGRVLRVYPALENGRVEADIETAGLEAKVFGERVRVWIPAGERQTIVAPEAFLTNRYGVDFARIRGRDGVAQDVVVRRGEPVIADGVPNAVEILSGLSAGDRLIMPLQPGAAQATKGQAT
jgi:RND family efflux transporter MFP subunit